MTIDPRVLDWLLDSDPALRWQVERDLLGAPPRAWEATRARIATEGWGARLLAEQGEDGQWAGGSFFPAGFFEDEEAQRTGQPWTATTWVLKDLREWGLDAAALDGTAEKLARNSRWDYNGFPYWQGEVDVCINAYTLATGAWLGADVGALAAWFVEHRLPDGGWNCAAEDVEQSRDGKTPDTRSSFHSTLNAVEGLLAYERSTGDESVREARRGGEEYLLERRLMVRASTGEVVGDFVGHLVYPHRHRYNALRALDHLRTVGLVDGTPPDSRAADAVEVVRSARQPDGTWLQGPPLPGATWFDVDAPAGRPSRWLTLAGSRVLEWWDDAEATEAALPDPRRADGGERADGG